MMAMNNNDDPKKQYGIQPYVRSELPSTYINDQDYEPENNVHLRDYLSVIIKRKWIVLSFLISIVTITMIYTFTTKPLYKSTVVIRIDNKETPDSLKALQVREQPDYYQTQYEILKSQTLAERVIRKLNLDKNPDFLATRNDLLQTIGSIDDYFMSGVYFLLPSSWSGSQNAKNSPQGEMSLSLIYRLISQLNVIPVKNSQLVQVSFSSQSPELAMNVTKAVADTFIAYDLESRVDASKEARDFLKNQIEITKSKIENSEKILNDYASKNGIIYLDSERQSIMTQKLSEITSALSTVSSDRMQKEALYKEVKESGTNNPVVTNNSLIMGLKKDHATLEAEYYNKLKTFTPDYPSMKNLKSQIDAIEARIEKEKSEILKSVQSDYKASQKKEAYLSGAFDAQQRKALEFQEKAVQYQTLKREVDVNKELHNTLMQKLNEVGVAAMSTSSNMQVLDNPRYPKRPYSPDKMLNFILSFIFGSMGGIGLAFLVEYFDNTVKSTNEIVKTIKLPSLGMIPLQTEISSSSMPKIVYTNSVNSVSEAFRSIGTFILLSSSSKPPKTILITSPGEKEGKSTICMNIALALTESLGNGVIIDADLRQPKLHKTFAMDNKIGLSSFLSGNLSLEGMNGKLIRPTPEKGLSIITSGPTPPNPSKLLYSPKMKDLLEVLNASYGFVIIDAPPIIGLSDSVLLSRIVDGTVLVVRAGETPKNAILASRQIFKDVNTNLLGVVLNGVKKTDLAYGYYSNYFSSYFKEGRPA